MPVKEETASLISQYFPEIHPEKKEKLVHYAGLLEDWNARINLISRKDTAHIPDRHILHTINILHIIKFVPGTHILDIGTGGGLPGIPWAILFPESRFTLVDSVAKKINAVQEMSRELGLENVQCLAQRAEQIREQYDFVTGRAVTALPRFVQWAKKRIHCRSKNKLANGIIYFKGDLFESELKSAGIPQSQYHAFSLENYLDHPEFSGKYLVHISFCE